MTEIKRTYYRTVCVSRSYNEKICVQNLCTLATLSTPNIFRDSYAEKNRCRKKLKKNFRSYESFFSWLFLLAWTEINYAIFLDWVNGIVFADYQWNSTDLLSALMPCETEAKSVQRKNVIFSLTRESFRTGFFLRLITIKLLASAFTHEKLSVYRCICFYRKLSGFYL